jgi:hypothetical protein
MCEAVMSLMLPVPVCVKGHTHARLLMQSDPEQGNNGACVDRRSSSLTHP